MRCRCRPPPDTSIHRPPIDYFTRAPEFSFTICLFSYLRTVPYLMITTLLPSPLPLPHCYRLVLQLHESILSLGFFQVHDPLAYALALTLLAYPIPAAYRNCTKCPHIGLPESSSSLYANCQPFNTYTVFGIIVRVIESFSLLGALGVLSVGAVRVLRLWSRFPDSRLAHVVLASFVYGFSSSVRPVHSFIRPVGDCILTLSNTGSLRPP